MNIIYSIQTNLTGMVILCIIFYNLKQQAGRKQTDQNLFIGLLAINFLLLLLELGIDLLSGKSLPGGLFILNFIAVVFYTANPIPGLLYVLYVYSLVVRRRKLATKFLVAIWIPVIINAIFSFLSIFKEFTFTIDASNTYHRGTYFLFMAASGFIYMIIGFGLTIIKRKALVNRHEFSSLLLFPLPVFAAAILQTLFYGINVLWLSLSFSLLFVYLNIQGAQVNKDYLTDLFNRRRFDHYLDYLVASKHSSMMIGGIMFDVDSFKHINDTHGHDMGDWVLKSVASILRTSFGKKDLIARLGGDEFAVLLEVDGPEDVETAVNRVKANLETFNRQGHLPFPISLSAGFGVCDPHSTECNAMDFIKDLDDRMYAQKQLYRSQTNALSTLRR